jgi:tetratricopeptide (TPR) repeat protein
LAVNVLLNLSVFVYSRDIAKGREFALQMLEISKREYMPTEIGSQVWLSYLDWLKGDWASAFDGVNKALEMAQRVGFTNPLILLGEVWRGLIQLSMGNLDQAENCVVNSRIKQSAEMEDVVSLNLTLGKIRLEQGREDEAKKCFETCVNAFRRLELHPMPPLQIETMLHLTAIYARHGRVDEAREMSEWAKRIAETLKGDACFALASQAEAALLLATGDSKGAEEAYLNCLDSWEKAGWPFYHGKALVAYSEAVAQTKPEESNKRLQQAVEVFKKLGAKRDLEQAEAKLTTK